ncbi:MAG: 2-C-methyl-D-erythritol 4-phosphate cytidylyltransferase [Chloroflexi bacterium]|nr:2-C-methyl-D-erythritol 4-phosphate cytidylyltransferase [Chloroflexota bacterium]
MNVAVITAAGSGVRMGFPGGKQYLDLSGDPLLAHGIRAFESSPVIDTIVVVVNESDIPLCRDIASRFAFRKVAAIVGGGAERQHSVYRGLEALPVGAERVAIHDGARPLVTPSLIELCFASLEGWEGVVPGVALKDTPKAVEGDSVVETLDRDRLRAAQTPQVFPFGVIIEAHRRARSEGFLGTDDASLVERIGGRVRLVQGSEDNIKITTPTDLVVAKAILGTRKQ